MKLILLAVALSLSGCVSIPQHKRELAKEFKEGVKMGIEIGKHLQRLGIDHSTNTIKAVHPDFKYTENAINTKETK